MCTFTDTLKCTRLKCKKEKSTLSFPINLSVNHLQALCVCERINNKKNVHHWLICEGILYIVYCSICLHFRVCVRMWKCQVFFLLASSELCEGQPGLRDMTQIQRRLKQEMAWLSLLSCGWPSICGFQFRKSGWRMRRQVKISMRKIRQKRHEKNGASKKLS